MYIFEINPLSFSSFAIIFSQSEGCLFTLRIVYMEFRKMVMMTLYAKQKKRHRCTEQTFGLWEKVRVECLERTASKHSYYLG